MQIYSNLNWKFEIFVLFTKRTFIAQGRIVSILPANWWRWRLLSFLPIFRNFSEHLRFLGPFRWIDFLFFLLKMTINNKTYKFYKICCGSGVKHFHAEHAGVEMSLSDLSKTSKRKKWAVIAVNYMLYGNVEQVSWNTNYLKYSAKARYQLVATMWHRHLLNTIKIEIDTQQNSGFLYNKQCISSSS